MKSGHPAALPRLEAPPHSRRNHVAFASEALVSAVKKLSSTNSLQSAQRLCSFACALACQPATPAVTNQRRVAER